MEEKLYTGQTTADRFEKLLADCHFPEDTDTWVLAERLPDSVIISPKARQKLLLFTYFKPDIPFTSYSSGRIFRENMEIRWEKQADQIHIVYVGTEEYIPVLRDYALRPSQQLQDMAIREEIRHYYLFGERLQKEDLARMGGTATTKDFAQVRIPRLLHYPVEHNAKPYVCLKVREYINPTTSIVELFRFQALKAVEVEGRNEPL